jgi:PiT family inorganic phosphate transporter
VSEAALFAAVLFLAYSNGANDNFKGVATLFGSGTASFKQALGWATVSTLAGSLASLILAGRLVKNFSGKGLVPDATAASPTFLLAVALGAGLTVILATWKGFPVSTTHALTGALVGAGFAIIGSQVRLEKLGKAFLLPLAVSPIVSLALAMVLFRLFRLIPSKPEADDLSVVPGDEEGFAGAGAGPGPAAMPVDASRGASTAVLARRSVKVAKPADRFRRLLDAGHFLSAGAVCFARGLNDTPKLVALLSAAALFGLNTNLMAIAAAMAIGGLLNARKVAETMSRKITAMNRSEGFAANLVTAALVVFASRWGMPVSTTHVTVGSISGIGIVTGKLEYKAIGKILLSWVLTLPAGALFGFCFSKIISAAS